MCMRALQLAGKEREDGKDRKRGRGSDRKRGRGRALVLAEFIEVGVKKCYTCSKHTDENPHTKPGQHILSSSSLTRSKITIKQRTTKMVAGLFQLSHSYRGRNKCIIYCLVAKLEQKNN